MKAEEDGRRGASAASLVSGGLGSENTGLAATAFKKGAGSRRSTRAPFLQTDCDVPGGKSPLREDEEQDVLKLHLSTRLNKQWM